MQQISKIISLWKSKIMLQQHSIQQLNDLKVILEKIDESEFTSTMETVFYSSIAKHTQHIITFYQRFIKCYEKDIINYEKRKRNTELLTNKALALESIDLIQQFLSQNLDEKSLILKIKIENESAFLPTSLARELLYLSEHTTHHLALIRLGLENLNPEKNLFVGVGMAYSTPKI